MNKTVKFSQNWNKKLNCKCFTTIRRPNPGYYIVGHTYDIYLAGMCLKEAQLIDIQKGNPETLSEMQARIDTGYDKRETLGLLTKMYGQLPPEVWYMTFVTTKTHPAPFKAMLLDAIEKFSENLSPSNAQIVEQIKNPNP